MEIDLPANGGTGHSGDYAWSPAAEKSQVPVFLLDDGGSDHQTFGSPDFDIAGRSACLEESLDHVQWSGQPRGKTPGQASRNTVGQRIVSPRGVHYF